MENKIISSFRDLYDYLYRNQNGTGNWHRDNLDNWVVCSFLTNGLKGPLSFSLKYNLINGVFGFTVERLGHLDIVICIQFNDRVTDDGDGVINAFDNLVELCMSTYF